MQTNIIAGGRSCFVFLFALFAGWCRHAEGGLPIVLHGGGQFFHVRDEAGYFPHVLLAESFLPRGHAGVTDASADGVEDVPLGVVGRIGDEVGSGWVEGVGERDGLAVESTMADGTVHSVELHAIFEVLIVRRQGVGDAGSVTLHGSVDGSVGNAFLDVRWGYVRVCGNEA